MTGEVLKMINELISIFERLIANKSEKFASHNDEEFLLKWQEVKGILERYKTDIFALCDLEQYNVLRKDPNGSFTDMEAVVNILRAYRNVEGATLKKEDEIKIRNYPPVIADIEFLTNKANRILNYESKYDLVNKQIDVMTQIIDELKNLGEYDYISADIITMIYDYLINEIYISYKDKYVNIGSLIAKHNIEVARKRTLF